jgi:hypothetical protein
MSKPDEREREGLSPGLGTAASGAACTPLWRLRAKAPAVAGREAGSLAIPAAIAASTPDGRDGAIARAEGTGSCIWRTIIPRAVSASYGFVPVNISKAVTARE